MQLTWAERPLQPLILPGTPGFSAGHLSRHAVHLRVYGLVGATVAVCVGLVAYDSLLTRRAEREVVPRMAQGVIELRRPPATTVRDSARSVSVAPAAIASTTVPVLVAMRDQSVAVAEAGLTVRNASVAPVQARVPTTDSAAARNRATPPSPANDITTTAATSDEPRVEAPIAVPLRTTESASAPLRVTAMAVAEVAPARVVAPAVAAPSPMPAADVLDDAEVSEALSSFVRRIRDRTGSSVDLQAFYSDGAEQAVSMRGTAPAIDAGLSSARTSIDLTLVKFDAVGRRITRVLPVSMTIAKRSGAVQVSAVAFGTLRKP